jgi:hypothetical protein
MFYVAYVENSKIFSEKNIKCLIFLLARIICGNHVPKTLNI